MADRVQIRRDTAAVWASVNPILADGEIGFERDTLKIKVGNGTDDWATLPYVTGVGAFVQTTGGIMIGPLEVPAGATGAQAIQAQEVQSMVGLTGAVVYFARNSAPSGWLKANGALVSRTTYADLFASIGTTFGVGDGSTTFALPDMRGEFIRGWDDGRGIDTGRVFGTAQSDEFKSHSHSASGFAAAGSGGSSNYSVTGLTQDKVARDTQTTGGSETRPRNIALFACIKY